MATARQPHQRAVAAERPSVASLSSVLTCSLCHGYLIDAVTIVKCLHSFCKSCILKRIKKESSCPVCDLRISMMKLDLHLKKDDVLQNLVYKAVPGLYQREMKRRRDFYSSQSKGDKTTLTPEERGEMDSSSKGRIIFSPDEAISLSLEYKHLSDQMFKSEKAKPEKQDTSIKELPKRYLNCPAAVTIALLQKFLRMKYSLGSRCQVDIYYMNDILWSKYTLMDVAYIYSWRRDAPLELSFWIWDPSAKQVDQLFAGANNGNSVDPPHLSTASSADEQTKGSSYLSNSVVGTESQCGSQRSKHDTDADTDTTKASKPAFTSGTKAKPAEVEPVTKHPDKVQSCRHEMMTDALSEEAAAEGPQTLVDVPCNAEQSTCPNAKDGLTLPCGEEGESQRNTSVNNSGSDLTSEKVNLAEDDNFGCARTSGSYSWKANIAKIVSTLEKCDDDLEDAVQAAVFLAMPVLSPMAVKDAVSSSAEVSNTTVSDAKVATASAAIVNGVGCDTFKSWRRASTEKDAVEEKKQSLNCTNKDAANETGNVKPEVPVVKTCVSRAADMAEAKLNAVRAAAMTALNKCKSETVPKENKTTESSPMVSTTSAVKVQDTSSTPQGKPSEASSVAKEPKEVASSETVEPVTTTTTVASTLPTYLTLSRSHPSLFHGTQKKRGRPKLATVNSLNEEIERAHMLASQAAIEIQAKPAIPVVTSLRIKPVLPPSDKTEQRSPKTDSPPKETDSAHHGDRSDSDEGRRKSKRRKTGSENTLPHSKEVSTPSDSPLGSPRNAGTPEKITLRVTRDETCTLKVEKLLRAPTTTASSDGLHDSGFCEDVVAEKSPASSDSKVKDDRTDKKASQHSRQVQEASKKTSETVWPSRKDVAGKNEKSKEKTVVTLKVSQLKDHKEKPLVTAKSGEQKKESRKGKRKSVEDWVKEQNKWINVDKMKSTDDRQSSLIEEGGAKVDTVEDAMQKGTSQRRGRKRTNPVKIEKLNVPAEAQQTAKSPPTPPVASCTTSSKTSDVSPVKEKSSPPNTPKKAVTELIIPKYIPNPASSIPLTVAHARNKRLKETPKAATASPCWNTSVAKSSMVEQQRGDCEKSKFFKEALNLSMKETSKVSQAPCSSSAKKPDVPVSAAKGRKGTTSSQIMKVVEKITASQKSGGKSENNRTLVHPEFERTVPQKGCTKSNSVSEERSPISSKGHTRGRLMGKMLVAMPTSRSQLEKCGRSSPQSPVVSAPTLNHSSAAPSATSPIESSGKGLLPDLKDATTEGAEMEILPKLNQAGVFRLEFPSPEQQNVEPHVDRASPSPSRAVEKRNSTELSLFENREDVAESIKNIARIRKSILESQQRSALSREGSTAVLENGQHEAPSAADCVNKGSQQISQNGKGRAHENDTPSPPPQEGMSQLESRKNARTEPSEKLISSEASGTKGIRSPTLNSSVPSNGPSTVIHIQKFVTASGKQKFTVLNSDDCRTSPATRLADLSSRSPSPSKQRSSRSPPDSAQTRLHTSDDRKFFTSPDTSGSSTVPYELIDTPQKDEKSVEISRHFRRRSPGVKKDKDSDIHNSFDHASCTNAHTVPVKVENPIQHSLHMDHGYSKQDPSFQPCSSKQDQVRPERQSISSSSNELSTEPSDDNLANARASEHMYRTTVAEIDLFTALSIIETMKGGATVHDIIEDYVTHLGKFFSMLEASDDQTQHLVEEAFRSKRAVLLRLVRLLKKLTTNLSSNQVSQVLALEVLIERFLNRCGHDAAVDDLNLDRRMEEVTTNSRYMSCTTSVLVEPVYSMEDLEEPKFAHVQQPSNEVTVTTTLEDCRVGRHGRPRKAKRGTSWKRRLMQVLKMDQPLWMVPVLPCLRTALGPSAVCFGPAVPPEIFDALLRGEGHAHTPNVQGPIQSLLPVSGALCSAPSNRLQLTRCFSSNKCDLDRSYLHLVSSSTNGRHPFFLPEPRSQDQTFSRVTNSDSLLPCQLLNPPSPQLERIVIAAICKLLRGDGVCDTSRTSEIPAGKIRMATVESTLVITSSNTQNKLMLSAEVGERLLRGLLSGFGTLPQNSCGLDLQSLFTVLVGSMSASRGNEILSASDVSSCLAPFRGNASVGRLSPASLTESCAMRTVHDNVVHSSCSSGQDYIEGSITRSQVGSGRDGLSKRSLPLGVYEAAAAVCNESSVVTQRLTGTSQVSCAKRIRISAPAGEAPNSIRKTHLVNATRDLAVVRANRLKLWKRRRVALSNTVVPAAPRPPVVLPRSCEPATSALSAVDCVAAPGHIAPLKRPAQDPVIPVLSPAKRPLNLSHIPGGKGERRLTTTLLRSPSCVVPRDRLVLLRCLDPAEQRRRRRAASRVKLKPKPVTSR